ncbi:MAG TPA: hypothetical protein VFX43_13920 [Chitinophagaceae bacterium]|nr:hypothetical protein [Chitinophagaceae bacterium]
MIRRIFQIVLYGLLCIPVAVSAMNESVSVPFKRNVIKTFNVQSGAHLNISNKYGKVNLHTWNKNQIQATITITTNGTNTENARDLANQVTIQSNKTSNNVSITTEYAQSRSSSFWKSFFGGGGGNGKNNIHIDYEVYLPQSLAGLTIKNNYGNVTGDDIPGSLSLDLNYGNFHLSKIGGPLELNANYCDGTLNDVKRGDIRANYTDFHLDKVNNLNIQSNYSDYKISKAGHLEIRSNYGDISAEIIATLISQTTYGDYKITTLSKQGNITTTYGDVNIRSLGDQFEGLTIKPTYSDVNIGVPGNLHVRLDIDLTHGDIRTDGISLQQVVKTDEHGKQTLKASSTGAGTNAPVINVSGTYSDVSLSGN